MRSKGNKETTLSFQMRTLRDIAKRLKIKATVTTYVARHSYAGVQKSGVGAVVSCDAAGNQRWVFTPDPAGKIDFSGPVLGADGTVYISVNKVGGQIAALDGQTGRQIWQYLCADGFGGTPAVDCYGNLVGVVTEVGLNWCRLTTILDTGSQLGAMVFRTEETAIAAGDLALMSQGKLKLTYLPDSSTLITGDLIVTSGLGGYYPYGLTIGSVEDVRTDDGGLARYAVLDPRCDPEGLTDLYIITDFDVVE